LGLWKVSEQTKPLVCLLAFEIFQTTGGLGERKSQQGTYNWLGLWLVLWFSWELGAKGHMGVVQVYLVT
jgi:hypothetical protein